MKANLDRHGDGVKSSWVCWLIAASLLAGLPGAAAARGKQRSPEELVNVLLTPGNAQWLVGPIARMASEEEVEAYLTISDDEEAERFIDEFWSGRQPIEGVPGVTARQQFEQLAQEADRKFGEAAYPGRRTDRGTIFIIYGPPDEVDFKPLQRHRLSHYRTSPPSSRHGRVEHWRYDKDRVGLDGRSPRRIYKFVRNGELVRFAPGSEP